MEFVCRSVPIGKTPSEKLVYKDLLAESKQIFTHIVKFFYIKKSFTGTQISN